MNYFIKRVVAGMIFLLSIWMEAVARFPHLVGSDHIRLS